MHETAVDYAQYKAVVIENYAGSNLDALKEVNLENPAYPTEPWSYYTFAVMGTITNVKVTSTEYMGAEEKVFGLAEEIKDSIVTVQSRFPTDFSTDVISFIGPDGQSYDFTVEDMSDNYAVITIK